MVLLLTGLTIGLQPIIATILVKRHSEMEICNLSSQQKLLSAVGRSFSENILNVSIAESKDPPA